MKRRDLHRVWGAVRMGEGQQRVDLAEGEKRDVEVLLGYGAGRRRLLILTVVAAVDSLSVASNAVTGGEGLRWGSCVRVRVRARVSVWVREM